MRNVLSWDIFSSSYSAITHPERLCWVHDAQLEEQALEVHDNVVSGVYRGQNPI